MRISLDIPDARVETAVREILSNFPDCVSSVGCTKWDYENWAFAFVDPETRTRYAPTKQQFIDAFPLMYTDKWPKGCTAPPLSFTDDALDDWLCLCDATDFDAYLQLVLFGEVVYG